MAVKSKVKSKSKTARTVKAKVAVKPKIVAKTKSVAKTKPVKSAKPVSIKMTSSTSVSTSSSSARRHSTVGTMMKRVVNTYVERRPVMPRSPRVHQFAYMKAPGMEHAFEVGDNVEVFCDHEKSKERIRGWVKGIVVQVDNKMVAVQFRSNVYLTDGWMVPDRILWYPLTSEHIRGVPGKKAIIKKEFIPDY
jgi:hypothetical protein